MSSVVQSVAATPATTLASTVGTPTIAAETRAAAPAPAPKAAPQTSQQSLSFEIDRDSGRPIVRLVDERSGEVIRQLPTEEALAISKELGRLQGLLIRTKA